MLRVTVDINKGKLQVRDAFYMTKDELDIFDDLTKENKNVLVSQVEEVPVWTAESVVRHVNNLLKSFDK